MSTSQTCCRGGDLTSHKTTYYLFPRDTLHSNTRTLRRPDGHGPDRFRLGSKTKRNAHDWYGNEI